MSPRIRTMLALSAAAGAGFVLGNSSGPSLRQSDDRWFATAAMAAETGGGAKVLHFDREKMDAAFANKSVLVDGKETRYRVMGALRNQPGVPEEHAKETDIFYIRSGKATFVTGGKMIGGKSTGPGEILGTSIEGGEEHHLGAGDVIIIPKGIPHWFRDVPGEFTYFVVKVR